MSYILVASPDKISLNNFIRLLLRRKTEKRPHIGEMHSLMSVESVELYVKDFTEKNPEGILSYYAKRLVSDDPISRLPIMLQKRMDTIIWFDLYSTEPKILKDRFKEIGPVIDSWMTYVKSLGGGGVNP